MARGIDHRAGEVCARAACAALILLCAAAPAGAQAQSPPPKWGAHLDLEGKLGNNRDLGEADVFLPLWQDPTTLLFGNIKARLDDNASREGNFGLGLRHMLESGWNLGTYGYFDRRRTETHNFFSQATFGLEALSLDWDLRANAYLPLGRRTHDLGSTSGSSSTAALSGNTVTITTPGSSIREERSLTGFDAEIGWRVPVFDAGSGTALRLFGGAYRFYADDVNPVQGPRARIELAIDEVSFLWSGSRLALGGEVQHDGPRGTTGFATARMRIPLQVFDSGANVARLNPLERRMADPVVRDIDVVSQSRTSSAPSTTETATQVSGGNALTVLDSGTTTGAALPGAITTAGANSTVLLSGTFTTSAAITPAAGQTLRGGGSFTVQSASGKTATLTTSNATIDRTTGSNTITVTNANVTITGLTLSNSAGAAAAGAITSSGSNLTVSNNTLSATSTGADTIALRLTGGSATLSGNTVTATGNGGSNAWAVSVESATATVTNNTVNALSGAINRHTNLNTATINTGSTGNTLGGSNTGGCGTSANGSAGADVQYTNAANCSPD